MSVIWDVALDVIQKEGAFRLWEVSYHSHRIHLWWIMWLLVDTTTKMILLHHSVSPSTWLMAHRNKDGPHQVVLEGMEINMLLLDLHQRLTFNHTPYRLAENNRILCYPGNHKVTWQVARPSLAHIHAPVSNKQTAGLWIVLDLTKHTMLQHTCSAFIPRLI